jgi:hypothetical protein
MNPFLILALGEALATELGIVVGFVNPSAHGRTAECR